MQRPGLGPRARSLGAGRHLVTVPPSGLGGGGIAARSGGTVRGGGGGWHEAMVLVGLRLAAPIRLLGCGGGGGGADVLLLEVVCE